MLRRIWNALVSLLREPVPDAEDLASQLEVQAERERAKEKWAADEARQSRHSAGTGPGI
jgi:hypothetical protein